MKSDYSDRHLEAVEEVLTSCGGEEARLVIFLFLDWRLAGASFLGLGGSGRSVLAWFHSL